ncbi:MAG: hypothetical protein OHK0029_06690 [Armatimonadaceae bacterium]
MKQNVAKFGLSVALATAGIGLLASTANAQLQPGYTIIGKDSATQLEDIFVHADVGVAYEVGTVGNPGFWDLHIHIDTPGLGYAEEYAPDEALLYLSDDTRRTLAADFDFLGATAGQTVWLIPAANPSPSPINWLGIGAEENAPGDFTGSVTLSLLSVTGFNGSAAPGQFAVWQPDGLGGNNVLMSTVPGSTAADFITLAVGDHDHYNWGFTAPGFYEVTFEAIGTPADGGPASSGPVTYYFGVETLGPPNLGAAAPEPGTLALAVAGLAGFAWIKRRRA